jgi:hypothetical protein
VIEQRVVVRLEIHPLDCRPKIFDEDLVVKVPEVRVRTGPARAEQLQDLIRNIVRVVQVTHEPAPRVFMGATAKHKVQSQLRRVSARDRRLVNDRRIQTADEPGEESVSLEMVESRGLRFEAVDPLLDRPLPGHRLGQRIELPAECLDHGLSICERRFEREQLLWMLCDRIEAWEASAHMTRRSEQDLDRAIRPFEQFEQLGAQFSRKHQRRFGCGAHHGHS